MDPKREAMLAKKRERERLRRLKDPEGFRAQRRAQNAQNPYPNRQRALAWARANPERMKARLKTWASANKQLVYARNRDWRINNRDKMNAMIRDWKQRNPDKVRVQRIQDNFRRRARVLNASGHAPKDKINARVAFFGDMCSYCKGPYEHLEHAIPLVRGGTNWPANLRPSCRTCNLRKGKKTIFEFLAQGCTSAS